ncbi:hypothetical protein KCU79_g2984, partial [Aureobasidium melanogenum]
MADDEHSSHPSSSEGLESIRSSPPASSVASDDDNNHIVASDSVHLVTIDSTLPIAPPRDEIQDWAKTKKARRRELWTAYVIEEAAERNVGDARLLTTTRGHNDRARCTYCINGEQVCQSFSRAVIGDNISRKCDWCLIYNRHCSLAQGKRSERTVLGSGARTEPAILVADKVKNYIAPTISHPLPITTAYHLGLAGNESPSTEDIKSTLLVFLANSIPPPQPRRQRVSPCRSPEVPYSGIRKRHGH